MKINRLKIGIVCLKVASVLTILFGLFMAFTSILPKNEPSPIDLQMNQSFFPESSDLTPAMMACQSWQYGVGAAMMVSWGILMFFLTSLLAERKIKTWNTMMIALFSWFVIDETISVFYGVFFNAVFNIVFLMLFLIPLLLIRPGFVTRN